MGARLRSGEGQMKRSPAMKIFKNSNFLKSKRCADKNVYDNRHEKSDFFALRIGGMETSL